MNVFTVLSQLRFDVAEAVAEPLAGLTQGGLGVEAEMAGQAGEGEEQIAEFVLLLGNVLGWQGGG